MDFEWGKSLEGNTQAFSSVTTCISSTAPATSGSLLGGSLSFVLCMTWLLAPSQAAYVSGGATSSPPSPTCRFRPPTSSCSSKLPTTPTWSSLPSSPPLRLQLRQVYGHGLRYLQHSWRCFTPLVGTTLRPVPPPSRRGLPLLFL